VVFRGLHERLKKLPKNPKAEKSIKRKKYLLKVAEFFDIKPDKPFNGKFYFEGASPNCDNVTRLNCVAD